MTAYKYRFSKGDLVSARDNSIFICVKKIKLFDGPFSTKYYTGESWEIVDLKNLIRISSFNLSSSIQKAYEMQILNKKETRT